MWFGWVPVLRFGGNFEWMHEIKFRKNVIPASRLYDLYINPRLLEAAWGHSMPRSFRPPYMVLKWLLLVSGCQKWPQPRAASSDLERPRILKGVVQPRGWNKIFVKSNFMHSLKISAKSEHWNPSKPYIFCLKIVYIVEAVLTSKVDVPNFFQLILKI